MPINVTVTNSGKIALPESVKMLVYTLAASRLNSKVCLFSLGLSRCSLVTHKTPNWRVITWRVDSRLSEFVKNWIFILSQKLGNAGNFSYNSGNLCSYGGYTRSTFEAIINPHRKNVTSRKLHTGVHVWNAMLYHHPLSSPRLIFTEGHFQIMRRYQKRSFLALEEGILT